MHRIGAMVLLWLLALNSAFAADLRVGAAQVKINPPIGIPMAGYYSARLAEGVHDDLFAKAIVLEKDGVRAALVSLDLITTTREMVEGARSEIERSTGVPAGNVMISATHAHTGPLLVNRGSRDDALGGDHPLVVQYSRSLPRLIAECVRLAESRLQPARALAGAGREERLSFVRRFHMKDGSVGWNPGKLNPNILRPTGPIDPDVPVVYFESADKRPLASYVNFAMHLDTVGGLRISADYPATVARLLADARGEDMVSLFTAGCCGNINHIDVSSSERQGGHSEAARIGTILAANVLHTHRRIQPAGDGSIRVSREIVKLPLPVVDSAGVDSARAIASRYGAKDNPPSFLETVGAFKTLDVAARAGKPHEVEVQVIALGNDLAFVSLPGEIFVELGLAIKHASPFRYTIVAELANGSIGYIPNREAYPQGNYEVVSARCAQGSGELLVDSALRQLRSLFANRNP